MKQSIKYLRLSSEDSLVGKLQQDESNSIASQRTLLDKYIENHPELGSFDELVDDGYSGTNFNRPSVKKLIELVESDKVDIILLKDLSRLGRNFLDVGFYLEIVFPAHGVRVISVNDGYDSAEHIEGTGGISIALQNLKNDFYSRDLSKKIRSSLEVQKERGEYHGQLPYGYVRGLRRHSVLIDENAASVIRLIFRMAAEEKLNTRQISVWLNRWKIPSPSAYRAANGCKCRVTKYWSGQAVCDILVKRSYTGDSELYKSHVIEMGSGRIKKIPRNEREIVLNTHEAIVSRETFQEAQKVILRHVEKPKIPPSPLKGYLYCGCCGNKLRRYSVTDHSFACDFRLSVPDGECSKVKCDASQIERLVLDTLQKLVQFSDEQSHQAEAQFESNREMISSLQKELESKKTRLKAFRDKKLRLYEQMVNNKLSIEGYRQEKASIITMEREIANEVSVLELRIEEIKSVSVIPESSVVLSGYRDMETLSTQSTKEMIKRIVVYPDQRIEIEFTFQDCLKK